MPQDSLVVLTAAGHVDKFRILVSNTDRLVSIQEANTVRFSPPPFHSCACRLALHARHPTCAFSPFRERRIRDRWRIRDRTERDDLHMQTGHTSVVYLHFKDTAFPYMITSVCPQPLLERYKT